MAVELILAGMTSVNVDTFTGRVEAAAEAGFRAMGLGLTDYRHIQATEASLADMEAITTGNGIRVTELEPILGFALPEAAKSREFRPGRHYTTASDLDDLWRLGDAFSSDHIVAVGTFDEPALEPDIVDRFAALCDEASRHGLRIALEPHPRTNIPNVAVALEIVRSAGRANGGINVDIWHYTRGGRIAQHLKGIHPGELVVAQISDGPLTPLTEDYSYETQHLRRIPGEGEFEVAAFLAALSSGSALTQVSVEVLSDKLMAMSADAAVVALHSAAEQVLPNSATAGGGHV